ncbi:MAG: 2-succinyl-6-hydroxy-2,4-cyclohexadiene-1-carboxylate synthase [Anaerolineales bacterium]|nr:2-succinyl-6-hydroxy-2,4-cyclohexadiene-1-carboxylate synthase [Anaerolineales bacterium]
MFEIPSQVNYVEQGSGHPVICIHGLAASLHDWDEFLPALASNHFHGYALDLLGHGDSPKPDSRSYKTKWALKHLEAWIDSLNLKENPVLVGHSLGGYLSLRYALRQPQRVRALALINPFYRLDQLPLLLRRTYRRPTLNALMVQRTPGWLFHWIVNITNIALGRTGGSTMELSDSVRLQTALDYKRTAPGAFNLPNTVRDLTSDLPRLLHPTLVLWGDRDQTLAPQFFPPLVGAIPNARGVEIPGGHVPHQSNVDEFNRLILEFLRGL